MRTETKDNYWVRSGRRLPRRAVLRGAGVGASALIGAALIGCGDDDPAATPATAGTSAATARATTGGGGQTATEAPAPSALTDATLRSAIANDIGSGDPQSLGGTGGGNWPNTSTHFGAGLLRVDPETGAFLPDLADEWEVLDEGGAYRFKLRPGIKFHNGEALDSDQVKFSMDRQLGLADYNPEYQGGFTGQFAPRVEEVEVVDDLNFVIRMKIQDVAMPARLGSFHIVPRGYIEDVGDDEFAANPIGLGPFQFVSRKPDVEIISERYEEFFRAVDSPDGVHIPFIKDLQQAIIPDSQASIAALEVGEVDLVHNVSSDLGRQFELDDRFKTFYLPSTQPMHVKMNSVAETDPDTGLPNPWRDVRVRKAANLAIDLDSIMSNLLTGRERPSFGVSSRAFGFPTGIEEERWGFDPEAAKALLAEAGFADGFDTTLWGPTGRWPNSSPVMGAIAQYLTDVGIRTTVREIAYGVVTERIKDDSLNGLTFFGASGSSEPGYALTGAYSSSGNFNTSEVNEESDALILQSAAEFDADKRSDLLQKVIRKLYLDDVQVIYLYEPVSVVVTSSGWDWDIYGTNVADPEYWAIRPAMA